MKYKVQDYDRSWYFAPAGSLALIAKLFDKTVPVWRTIKLIEKDPQNLIDECFRRRDMYEKIYGWKIGYYDSKWGPIFRLCVEIEDDGIQFLNSSAEMTEKTTLMPLCPDGYEIPLLYKYSKVKHNKEDLNDGNK